MRIDGCWITKGDEELKKLKKSIASVSKYLDEIHITANAKHEKTRAWCEKNGYDFTYLPWDDDFSKQRNFNFSRARGADYVWWMDSDDVLVGGEWLRKIADRSKSNGVDIVHFTYYYSNLFDGEPSVENFIENEISQTRERLINPKVFFWKGRLHETPVEIPNTSPRHDRYLYDKKRNPIVVMHLSAERGEDKKRVLERNSRNKRILEAQLKDERENGKPDPRTLLYLMKIYEQEDNEETLKECLKMGLEYLNLSGWDQERSLALTLMGKCYIHLGIFNEAERAFTMAINEFPYLPNPYLWLAETYTHLKDYKKAKHWWETALKIEYNDGFGIDLVLENKILVNQIGMSLNFNFVDKRNSKDALAFAKKLYELNPIPENEANLEMITHFSELNEACRNTDNLLKYLIKNEHVSESVEIVKSLPKSISEQPFAIKHLSTFSKPRHWQQNEICYFANFGSAHVEKWDGNSLKKGIGGSETAVIELSEQWVKMGYKVTVYGDPQQDITINGVTYLPYYKFNRRDKFNIFIQWRNAGLAELISAKKIYIDLHDVVNVVEYKPLEPFVDAFMVKSEAHKRLLKGINDTKIAVISNGIRL